jgi:hypothetical protein
MDRVSFENQIFTWSEWAQHEGPLSLQFKDVVLTVPVGDFPVGTKFPYAILVGDGSLLVLVDDQKQEFLFDLKLTVGEAVEIPQEGDCHEGCSHHH